MPRHKPPARDQRLSYLKAFGLFIRGDHTYYQIAEKLGIASINPASAASRARSRVEQGWRIILERKVSRWERYYLGVKFPMYAWQTLRGARLDTHPRLAPEPPPKPMTPFEQLLAHIAEVETEARNGYFTTAADGLRNLRVALKYAKFSEDAERETKRAKHE